MNLPHTLITLATLAGLGTNAQAANVTPSANLADWTCNGACGAVAPGGDIGSSHLLPGHLGLDLQGEGCGWVAHVSYLPIWN